MTNHLARTESLYLRKHAENPIDWWPWCPEALETARRENKPIFLSIQIDAFRSHSMSAHFLFP